MTVTELIAALQALPVECRGLPVALSSESAPFGNPDEIDSIDVEERSVGPWRYTTGPDTRERRRFVMLR